MLEQDDILVAMTDPPLLSILGSYAAHRKCAHLANWLQDIYPEIATEMGVPLMKRFVNRLLYHARDASLRTADANVVLGKRMAEKIANLSVSFDRICVVPNWSDDEKIKPIDPGNNPLRAKWHLQDKFVIGYFGNLGRVDEFETMLAASQRFKNDPHTIFLVIGGGYRNGEFVQRVNACGLANKFLFLPYQHDDVLTYSLSVPDVHWISLLPELEGLIVPSKVYGIAAANGEIARLVDAYHCGIVVAPGDPDALVKTIRRLSSDAKERASMGRRARAMLEAQFTRRRAFKRWGCLIHRIESHPARPNTIA